MIRSQVLHLVDGTRAAIEGGVQPPAQEANEFLSIINPSVSGILLEQHRTNSAHLITTMPTIIPGCKLLSDVAPFIPAHFYSLGNGGSWKSSGEPFNLP